MEFFSQSIYNPVFQRYENVIEKRRIEEQFNIASKAIF